MPVRQFACLLVSEETDQKDRQQVGHSAQYYALSRYLSARSFMLEPIARKRRS
jgi:hypothetical protein